MNISNWLLEYMITSGSCAWTIFVWCWRVCDVAWLQYVSGELQ